MKKYGKNRLFSRWLTLLLLTTGADCTWTQQIEQVYRSDVRTDSTDTHPLSVTVDNLNFFRNNEWVSAIAPGYTLPGFRLQPKVIYRPTKHVRLEAGVHSLWYWGANRYPSYPYTQLPYWEESRPSDVLHLLPYLRAQVAFSEQVQIVLGNIYGGADHRLAEPLYNPELNLTADPEAGLQMLYHTSWVDLDAWVNWIKFIYHSDVRQESLVGGLSVHLMANAPESGLHICFPLQALAQHQGGQIDVTDLPVQTVVNGLAGIRLEWNLRQSILKKVCMEWDLAGYYQPAGERWPLKRGYGSYTSLSAVLSGFQVKVAYWQCDRFISILGNPLFGVLRPSTPDAYFDRPKMVVCGVAYTRRFAPGLMLGIDFDLFQRFAANLRNPVSGVSVVETKSNYSFGVYFRATPSILIGRF
ncbi:MAG: hypothetical protein LBD27_00825 [Tannerella sp.]|jgi:hypothetical protein|nr:hypothetical protein [Tannerella sp.]